MTAPAPVVGVRSAERGQLAAALIQAIQDSEAARARGDTRDVSAARCYSQLQFDFPLITVTDLTAFEAELAAVGADAFTKFPLTAKLVSNICDGAAKTPVTPQVSAYQKLAGRILVANLPLLLQLPLAQLDAALSKLPFEEPQAEPSADSRADGTDGTADTETATAELLDRLALGDAPQPAAGAVGADEEGAAAAAARGGGDGSGSDSDDSEWEALESAMPSASHGGAFHDPDAAAAAAAEAAAAAATPERRCAARLRWLAACVAYKAVRDKGVWEALDLSVAACDALKACVSGAEGPGPLADTDTDPLQRQLANLLCDRMIARPEGLSRLSWAVDALRGDPSVAPARFPSPQQELQAALLSRLCAHFAAPLTGAALAGGGGGSAEAPPANPAALKALWVEVEKAMGCLFVPLAESVSEALAPRRASAAAQQRVDLRSRAQQFGDALTFFVLNAPPGAAAAEELLRSGAVRAAVMLFAAAGHGDGLFSFRRAVLLAVAALPKVAEFAAQVPAFQEKLRGEGFSAGGPGHAVGLVWPAITASTGPAGKPGAAAGAKGQPTGGEGAAAGEGAADPSAVPELFALLSQQPCDAVAIDALYLLLDVARARAAHGQPPLRQLHAPLTELQGRLRAAMNEAAAAAAAATALAAVKQDAGVEAGGDDGEKKGTGGLLEGPPKETAAAVEAEKVKVRAGLALRAVKELLLLLSGGVRKND